MGIFTPALTFAATITARDSTGNTASASVNLVVVAAAIKIADSRGVSPPALPVGTTGLVYDQFLLGQGGNQSSYTWSVIAGNLPPGISPRNGPNCPQTCTFELIGTPTKAGMFTFTGQVQDSFNNSGSAALTIVINAGPPPQITTTTYDLSNNRATIGGAYSFRLSASGGEPPYQWSFVGNYPDSGLQLSSGGVLNGTPTLANDCLAGPARFPQKYSFQVRVTDSVGQSNISPQFCLPSYWPTPQISSISPSSIPLDGQPHTVTISGSKFRSDAAAYANYSFPVTAQYVNSSTLTLSILASSNDWGAGSLYTIDVSQSYSDLSNVDKTISFH